MNGEISEIQQLKIELLHEINQAAGRFVDKHLNPISALNDKQVQEKILQLNALKKQLINFIDALEKYANTESLLEVPFALEKMLIELEKLNDTIVVLQTSNDPENKNIKLIRNEIDVLVKKLLADDGIVDKLVKGVPPRVIEWTMYFLSFLGVQTVAYYLLALRSAVTGGTNVLAILGGLNLTTGMIAAVNEKKSPLEPIRIFFDDALKKLQAPEDKVEAAASTTAEVVSLVEVKPLKNDEVIKAQKVLVNGFDDQVRKIVKENPDGLALAADLTVLAKIAMFEQLKLEINDFLYAADDYLEGSGLPIAELNNLLGKLNMLKITLDKLHPNKNDVMTEEVAAMQKGINQYVNLLTNDPVIIKLMKKLSESYILSTSIFLMQKISGFVEAARSLLFLLPKTLEVALHTLLGNLETTSLPVEANKQENQGKDSFEILHGYFNGLLTTLTLDEKDFKIQEKNEKQEVQKSDTGSKSLLTIKYDDKTPSPEVKKDHSLSKKEFKP